MKKNKIIFILALTLTCNYGFWDIKGIFYNAIKNAFQISDVKMGYVWAVYGIVSLVSFPIGGYLADLIKPKKMICFASASAVILHIWLSVIPSYPVLLLIAALLGMSSILIYYPASTKMIVSMYDSDNVGKMMGIYYALDGLFLFLVNIIFSMIYRVNNDSVWIFRGLMVSFALLGILSLFLVVRYLPESGAQINSLNKYSEKNFNNICYNKRTNILTDIMQRQETWLIAGTVIAGYSLFSLSTYVTPYLTEVWNVPEKDVLMLGVIRANVLNIIAGIFFGKWSAKWKSGNKTLLAAFIFVTAFPVLSLLNQKLWGMTFLEIVITSVGVFLLLGIKSISLSIITEVNYPEEITGRVLGLVSLIGFSPDVWLYPLVGRLLESYGIHAYFILTCMAFVPLILGIVCGWKLKHNINSKRIR